ncbi:creatininase family protein [Paenibacillus lutrae]|uniref:creatininase family protein n=1 Tax=Paenibacillus lutrae TaxID=2078573 RepID=UPI0012FAA47C
MTYSIFEDTMSDMSWTEIQASIDKGAIVLLPSGVIEQQGPHIATGSDIYVSHLICRKIRNELRNNNRECLIAPPFYWGINHVTGGFPGSFTSRKETVIHVLFDIFASLKQWGVKQVFLVDIHGDSVNGEALYEAITAARTELGLDARSLISHWIAEDLGIDQENDNFLIFDVDLVLEDLYAPEYLDVHAGESCTAMMNKFFPELVNVELVRELESTNLSHEDFKKWLTGGEVAKSITPYGYFGAPADYGKVDLTEINFVDSFSKFASIRLMDYLK